MEITFLPPIKTNTVIDEWNIEDLIFQIEDEIRPFRKQRKVNEFNSKIKMTLDRLKASQSFVIPITSETENDFKKKVSTIRIRIHYHQTTKKSVRYTSSVLPDRTGIRVWRII
jgi:hypothetical protein